MPNNQQNHRLQKSLRYLSWHLLAGAVLDAFRANEQQEKTGTDYPASSDAWLMSDVKRRQLFLCVRDSWILRARASTGEKALDECWFPYSIDAVVRMYHRFRKRSAEEVDAFSLEIDQARP